MGLLFSAPRNGANPTGRFMFGNASVLADNRSDCMLLGTKDKLFYWPEHESGRNASETYTAKFESHIFTSPTIYMEWKNIKATFYTPHPNRTLGTLISSTIIPIAPESLYSWALIGSDCVHFATFPMTYSDFQLCSKPPTDTKHNLRRVSRTVIYEHQEMVMCHDPCYPFLNWPAPIWSLEPEWASCEALGVIDPPYQLTPYPILVTTPVESTPEQTNPVSEAFRASVFNPIPAMTAAPSIVQPTPQRTQSSGLSPSHHVEEGDEPESFGYIEDPSGGAAEVQVEPEGHHGSLPVEMNSRDGAIDPNSHSKPTSGVEPVIEPSNGNVYADGGLPGIHDGETDKTGSIGEFSISMSITGLMSGSGGRTQGVGLGKAPSPVPVSEGTTVPDGTFVQTGYAERRSTLRVWKTLAVICAMSIGGGML